jgi:thiaminase/transcriptional activator TenA
VTCPTHPRTTPSALQRLSKWIDLHEGPVFRAWVAFLCGELDRLGPELDEDGRLKVFDFFRRAVRLELRFFDMAAGF